MLAFSFYYFKYAIKLWPLTLPMTLPRMLQRRAYVLCSYLPRPLLWLSMHPPPNGVVLVRMSPRNLLIICLTRLWNSWSYKDALIPEVAPVCMGNSSARSFFDSSAPGCSINDSFGLRLLTLIGDLGWFKAGGTLRDQAKISTLKSFSSRWGLAPARTTSLKSFLRNLIKFKGALLCFLCYRDWPRGKAKKGKTAT